LNREASDICYSRKYTIRKAPSPTALGAKCALTNVEQRVHMTGVVYGVSVQRGTWRGVLGGYTRTSLQARSRLGSGSVQARFGSVSAQSRLSLSSPADFSVSPSDLSFLRQICLFSGRFVSFPAGLSLFRQVSLFPAG